MQKQMIATGRPSFNDQETPKNRKACSVEQASLAQYSIHDMVHNEEEDQLGADSHPLFAEGP